jgi:thioredoxin reductase (NADPH)
MELKATMEYDLVIIGAGPIGLSCALAASQAGLSYLVIEKGCLVNSIYHYPVNMQFFSTSERLEIGEIPFVSNNAKPFRNEALEYYRRVAVTARLKIHLFEELTAVDQINPHHFQVKTTKSRYRTNNLILATGFYGIPYLLHIPGEELAKLTHYYQDPHFYAFQKVLIVGANNSAVDAALETWRKGAEVTMVIREADIGERVKYWARPDIINRIKEGSIKAYFHSKLTAIRDQEVDIETPEGILTIPNDRVIAMTGYMPDLALLETMGIQLSEDELRKPALDEQNHQTNIEGIYLAGVICGGMDTHRLFIENSREHADKIINHILSQKS